MLVIPVLCHPPPCGSDMHLSVLVLVGFLHLARPTGLCKQKHRAKATPRLFCFGPACDIGRVQLLLKPLRKTPNFTALEKGVDLVSWPPLPSPHSQTHGYQTLMAPTLSRSQLEEPVLVLLWRFCKQTRNKPGSNIHGPVMQGRSANADPAAGTV